MAEDQGHQARIKSSLVESQIFVLKTLLGTESDCVEEREEASKVWKWIDLVIESRSKNSGWKIKNVNGEQIVVVYLKLILRECLLNHRWEEAAEVLQKIAAEPRDTAVTLHHVGLELMQRENSPETRHLAEQYLQLVKSQTKIEICPKVVALDNFFLLMKEEKFDEALKALVTYPWLESKVYRNHAKQVDDYLHKAYEGLGYYAQWLILKHRKNADDEDELLLSGTASQGTENMIISLAEKAISCFSCLKDQYGVFDTFVYHHMEILEFLNRLDEAKELLESYADRNSQHPNAKKMLLDFYQRHEEYSQGQTELLQSLFCQVPSDAKVALAFHEKLIPAENNIEKAIEVLVCCLDYDVNSSNEKLWMKLAQDIVEHNDKCAKFLEKLWSFRSSWWPEYHFDWEDLPDCKTLSDTEFTLPQSKLNLWLSKAAVAFILSSKQYKYSHTVLDIVDKLNAASGDMYDLVRRAKEISKSI